jgi:cobalt-zinc-cadmium efflux system membrane fusion protein
MVKNNHTSFFLSLYRLLGMMIVLMFSPTVVLAHAGHGDEFKGASEGTSPSESIQVDSQTAQRLGIKIEPVTRQRLAIGIKTTGQIEALPNQKVQVTAPIDGTVVELLVKPGDKVSKGQPVAILTSSELVQLRVESAQKRADAQGEIKQAQANVRLAQENLGKQRQIAIAEIEQARTELSVSQEQYDRDLDLVNAGALPRRQMLESKAHLAEGKAQFTKANSRQAVSEAEAELKRTQAALEVAQSRLNLSNTGYQTRLQQLGTFANEKGLVTVVAPISGTVADRAITLGESVEAATKSLMTLLNNSQVFATANVYEKDLNQIKLNQPVRVNVTSLPNRTFTGKITLIGSVVEGETRIVPVKAELSNPGQTLKPGMFAEIEVLTDRTATPLLVIPRSAVVEANGRKIVYLQNGDAFQPTEVTLGQTSGDRVEVKTGLFEEDLIVTQRAPQLYAQSLRGDNKSSEAHDETVIPSQVNSSDLSLLALPWWWVISAGGGVTAIALGTFAAGAAWGKRKSQSSQSQLPQEPTSSPRSLSMNPPSQQPSLSSAVLRTNNPQDSQSR